MLRGLSPRVRGNPNIHLMTSFKPPAVYPRECGATLIVALYSTASSDQSVYPRECGATLYT